jgi:hypothetical protein
MIRQEIVDKLYSMISLVPSCIADVGKKNACMNYIR